MRAEGLAETLGDILLTCSGAPGSVITLNFSVFLNVSLTNRISAANATDVSLTVDSGSGPVPAGVPGLLQSSNSVSFNGVTFTVPPSGAVNLRISNLRGNVSQIGFGFQQPVLAVLSVNGFPAPLITNATQLSVGVPGRGLLSTLASTGIRCVGSPLPAVINFANLLSGGTRFVSTRVTEGYPDAFLKKAGTNDTGIRIVASYSGFPAGARIFVPDVVAGSGAVQPTAAGDLGGTPSGGAYAPGAGSLLLSRVLGTDANGRGGSVLYTPGAPGSGTVAFNSVSEVPLVNGAGIAVYEVVDANSAARETAQFPTFLGIPPVNSENTPVASEQVSLGPLSTVSSASSTEAVPRFLPTAAPSDCAGLGDCSASFFPSLSVTASQPLQFTAIAGSALQTKTVQVNNRGGGVLSWTATIGSMTGSGWLTINPSSGVNGGTILVNVFPQNMAPGVYSATLIVSGGTQAGTQTLPISATITALPQPPPSPTVVTPPAPAPVPAPAPKVILLSLVNGARPDLSTVAPGSVAIVTGSHFQGKDVAVTFDGVPAAVLASDDESIQVQVPLSAKGTSRLQVVVDGEKSVVLEAPISELAPAIFARGVLNGDSSVNTDSNAAPVGSGLQIFSTGLFGAGAGPVMVKLHDRRLAPSEAGAVPGMIGVEQVNITIPDDLPAMTTELQVCGFGSQSAEPVCSRSAFVTLK
ncbi:MAG TPA: IPT/TIG domain-containing protein [Bryobacteraceae bacterium]|nr:IPT/TIG domain-containing protein [Bryobacteraceae bacterium]